MATGIVSIAAADNGYGPISGLFAVLAVLGLLILTYRAVRSRRSFDLSDVDVVVGLFTFVAACAVLASRFSGYRAVLWGLGAVALLAWLYLTPLLIRSMRQARVTGLRDRARGTWELSSVATSGLAIVCAAMGNTGWALVFWAVGLGAYGVMTLLIAWRAFGEPAVRRNVPPDHWILMGALAIATLAGEHIYALIGRGPVALGVRIVTLLTLSVAAVQIVPLAITSWRQILDWPAVFPLGMFSEATYAMSIETGWRFLSTTSLAFFGIALVAWVLVVAVIGRGQLRSRRARAGDIRSDPAT